MKTLKLVLFALFFPMVIHAQKSLTGVWTGALTNDSVTIRKSQTFEIALTQYKEKVYGYSRSTFIVNDTLFYMVKRVKGKIEDGVCEVKDDDIISCNFPTRIDRGVKLTVTFRMNQEDSAWKLEGDWKTNKTKKFYSISGKASLREDKDPESSRILAHLQELNVKDAGTIAKIPSPPVQKIKPADTQPVEKDIAKAEAATKKEPAPTSTQNSSDKPAEEKASEPVVVAKTKEQPVVKKDNNMKAEAPKVTADPAKDKAALIEKPLPSPPVAARFVKERSIATSQVISFSSDSLQLALYDNGEIDGDTVSVLLNGNVILSKQGLRASAIRHTITVPADAAELVLILYAENLGKYPPNTGLLIVHDGEETYQVRFSADLNQNAAIIFRRKTK